MKKLEFKIDISATAKKVWDTMLAPKTYKEWVGVSWPGSDYQGKWAKGQKIRFQGEGQSGGTVATIDEFKPYESLLARHIAVINADGTEDYNSEVAKGWVGTLERYTFAESKGKTTLTVGIETNPDWEKMFQDGWPGALKALKEISER
jgi:uncharacterized protein YndB with AHSA1/START domain